MGVIFFIFLNAQKEIQKAVLFAQVELPGGRISFGLESLLLSQKKMRQEEICGKNKDNLWERVKRHKTNYFTTESFLSPLRDFPWMLYQPGYLSKV